MWLRQCWRDKERMDVSLVAQFATHQEILPKLNSIYKSGNFEKNGISSLPRSILRTLHWIFNPEFEPYVQRDWVFALLFFLLFYYSFGRFCFFRVVGSVTSLGKKRKENSIGPTLNASTSAWTTPCQKIKSRFIKLMEAWPIRRLNIFMFGPARDELEPLLWPRTAFTR